MTLRVLIKHSRQTRPAEFLAMTSPDLVCYQVISLDSHGLIVRRFNPDERRQAIKTAVKAAFLAEQAGRQGVVLLKSVGLNIDKVLGTQQTLVKYGQYNETTGITWVTNPADPHDLACVYNGSNITIRRN